MNSWYVREHLHIVLYNVEGNVFKSNYRRFESRGMLCAHIFKLIIFKDITEIHERHVLRRWKKDIYHRHNKMSCDTGYPHMIEEYKKFKKIDKICNETADVSM